MAATHLSNNIRYEPDENPPLSVAIGTGIQSALVNLGGIVLGAVIVFRIAGQPESYISWAIFAALIVSGISTFLQAVRFWRIGSGHLLVMGTSGAFIRKAAIVGLSFWIGVGFQAQVIFPHLLGDLWGTLLSNGMTSGAIVAIGMMLFLNLSSPRRKRIEVGLSSDAFPEVDGFVRGFASESQWDTASTERLMAASEETIAILMEEAGDDVTDSALRLAVSVRLQDESADLEFVTSFEGENMEDYLAYLSDLPPVADEHEVSYRLLWHYASSVRHQKYNNIDIITVNVEGGR